MYIDAEKLGEQQHDTKTIRNSQERTTTKRQNCFVVVYVFSYVLHMILVFLVFVFLYLGYCILVLRLSDRRRALNFAEPPK